jgi:F0F1-type ATP synthase assembly protein I
LEERIIFRSLALATQVGAMVVGSILVCLFLGLWIDGKLHTKPCATLILIAVGTLVAIAGTYRLARSFMEEQLEESKKENS